MATGLFSKGCLGNKYKGNIVCHCMEEKDTNVLLLYSSCIFTSNILTTFFNGCYFYCFLFCCLTVSSLIFHYEQKDSDHVSIANIVDKICISAIVSYGGYMLYQKYSLDNPILVGLIVIAFIWCIFLFFYGYYVNDYCYHPDKCVGNKYHCMLHLISSIGHHLIVFL